MTDRYIIAIGGGELFKKTTLEIDRYIANLAKMRAGSERRAVGVFIGTASHDSMPYFNTFRKTYTGEFNLKADCVLSVYGEMNAEKIRSKFEKADLIYIGGGDTLYMLNVWKEKGIFDLVLDAYDRGVIIAGLSAGAICWFENMYTDSELIEKDGKYSLQKGIGVLEGLCCPHYELRIDDFEPVFEAAADNLAWAMEDDSALVFKNGSYLKALSSGGHAYKLIKTDGKTVKTLLF